MIKLERYPDGRVKSIGFEISLPEGWLMATIFILCWLSGC
jgi:hypothetical protein